MTPQLAIGFLAVLIALIGTAFHLRIFSFHATSKIAQLTIRKKGGERITFFGRTWLMGLIGAGMLAALGFCLVVANHAGLYLGGAAIMFGAFVQNYLWPATGAASPTAAQVQNQDSVVVDCTTDGVITTFTLTHNLNISAADITNGFPDIFIEPNSPTGIPATLLILITRPIASGNAVIFTCAAVAATFRVKIKRPFSEGR